MAKPMLTLTEAEADELYRYLEPQYLSPNTWPRLSGLWTRISIALRKQEALLKVASR
jgi:hypothetical protein